LRILILGGDGMLGHRLWHHFASRHETRVTLRMGIEAYSGLGIFDVDQAFAGVDVRHEGDLLRVFAEFRPDAVINAIGIIKQRDDAEAALPCLELNAVFPHRLSNICGAAGARLIHLSTDCVFSGERGAYTEADDSDARDLYGRSKFLGEVQSSHCVTLRKSAIGLELGGHAGLVEWFLAQRGTIKGYTKAIYSGFTAIEMARIIERVLTQYTSLSGLWHVASKPISKYDLLRTLCEKLGRDDVVIEPDNEFVCDRSLRGDRFEATTGYRAPAWDAMLEELAEMINMREGRE
jgi:dTDP-4-dehydrorhamnose reductase